MMQEHTMQSLTCELAFPEIIRVRQNKTTAKKEEKKERKNKKAQQMDNFIVYYLLKSCSMLAINVALLV